MELQEFAEDGNLVTDLEVRDDEELAELVSPVDGDRDERERDESRRPDLLRRGRRSFLG